MAGDLVNLFRAALDGMMMRRDWPPAATSLSALQKHPFTKAMGSPTNLWPDNSAPAPEIRSWPQKIKNSAPGQKKELYLGIADLPLVLNLLAAAGLKPPGRDFLATQVISTAGVFDLKKLLAQVHKTVRQPGSKPGEPPSQSFTVLPQMPEGQSASASQSDTAPPLRLPPEQLPHWQALFVRAGMSPQAAERIFASASAREQGLSLVKLNAWLAERANAPEPASPPPLTSLTAQPAYARQWHRLALSPADFPQLCVLLQQAGAAPEVLAQLRDRPQPSADAPVRLAEIWSILKSQPRPDSTMPVPPGDSSTPPPLEQLTAWRELLLRAGMPPALAEQLVATLEHKTNRDFCAALLDLAPSAAEASREATSPKPVFWITKYLYDGEASVSLSASQQPENNFSPASGRSDPEPRFPPDQVNNPGKVSDPAAFPDPSSAAVPVSTPESKPASETLAANTWNLIRHQVKEGILRQAQPGATVLRLALNPPELGTLHLQLSLKGNLLQVTAVTVNPAVAQAVERHLVELQQGLAQQGLTLEKLQVYLTANQLPDQLLGAAGFAWELNSKLPKGRIETFAPRAEGKAKMQKLNRRRINYYV